MNVMEMVAPPGLKGLIVADTSIGGVCGAEGFFHYRGHDATEVASDRSFEAVAHLLLHDELPSEADEAQFRLALAAGRRLPESVARTTDLLAAEDLEPLSVLRGVLATALASVPMLDQSHEQRIASATGAIAMTPTVLARAHRRRAGLRPIDPDPTLPHAVDYVRMVTGSVASEKVGNAVQTYLSLTADHGFNASTFTGRVIASTGTDMGGVLAGALAALAGPLHGGAPRRVLDMLDAIGDPANAEDWAAAELESGRKLMGFGHAVYRAEDPRSELLRGIAAELGGDLVGRAMAVEERILAVLREWKPGAVLVTNVEYYAAVVLSLAGIPQDMFTSTFATSRIVGWCAHLLEQANADKIMRPSARYVGPEVRRRA